ncbi:MAG: hypothetical protein KIT45_05755 [Fimbriimonadia bacterium]|nr:hypothetical protein [Fimbriimonadia bacterium]
MRRANLGGLFKNPMRFWVAWGAAVYFAALWMVYAFYISPSFETMGYLYFAPDAPTTLFLFLLACLPVAWLPLQLKKPSTTAVWLLYLLVYMPVISVPVFRKASEPEILASFNLTLLFAFYLLGQVHRLPALKLRPLALPPALFWAGLLAFSGLVGIALIGAFGFTLNLPSLLDVYGVREQFSMSLAEAGSRLSYLIRWQMHVINPLLMAFGFLRRQYLLLAFGVVFQLYIFAITGFKTCLFFIPLTLMMAWLIQRYARSFALALILSIMAAGTFSLGLDILTGTNLPSSLVLRRFILTPGLLTGYYVDFFTENPKTSMAGSIVNPFTENVYGVTNPEIIGNAYFPPPAPYANANLFASGFADFGYAGVLLVTIAWCGFLWLYDSIAQKRDLRLMSAFLAPPAVVLVNSDLITSLLGHGIALTLAVAVFLPVANSLTRRSSPQPHPKEMASQQRRLRGRAW